MIHSLGDSKPPRLVTPALRRRLHLDMPPPEIDVKPPSSRGKSPCEDRPTDESRIGKMVPSDTFDGKMTLWYHASCFLCLGVELRGGAWRPRFNIWLGGSTESGFEGHGDPQHSTQLGWMMLYDTLGQNLTAWPKLPFASFRGVSSMLTQYIVNEFGRLCLVYAPCAGLPSS